MEVGGYLGNLLRVDLSREKTDVEALDRGACEKWVGGVGFGADVLYREVPGHVGWSDPENRIVWTTGPLAGSGVYGAGTFNVAAKGPMTGLAGCSQANGYFGAYMKFSGFDGILFQGKAPDPVYIVLKGGRAEIRDARHLAGKDTLELEADLRKELAVAEKDVSIYGIGPAGERGVYFSAVMGDGGHAAAHNGLGAVMGSKNVKAVVAYNGRRNFAIRDPRRLKESNAAMFEQVKSTSPIYKCGTGGLLSGIHAAGAVPVKNYRTNLFPEHERMNGQYLRSHFLVRSKPCFRCPTAHVKEVTVTEGPYKGFVGEEPEFEQISAWGPQIGNTELGAVVMLATEVDRLGLDCNESAWVVGWVMECYEKGVFSKKDLDGLDMSWGNVEAVRALLGKIARREGIGELLSRGVMRAARTVGGEAADWAVYTQKGASPRGIDHRGGGRWYEFFDTCVSNTSTLEVIGGAGHPSLAGFPPAQDPFSHEEVSTLHASYSGIRMFDDCLGTCRFCCPNLDLQLACVNAVTGWELTIQDTARIGRRIMNVLRLFNLRHGLRIEDERPSKRYGSVPVDGPAVGKDITAKWGWMIRNYYTLMGWDPKTGRPLPQTLAALGIEDLDGQA